MNFPLRQLLPRPLRSVLRSAYTKVLRMRREAGLLPTVSSYIENWTPYLFAELLWHKPFEAKLKNGLAVLMRPGTYDTFIIDEIFRADGYGDALRRLDPAREQVVVDLGAHIGCFSLRVAELLPRTKIVAVEAVPENAEYLQYNIARNNFAERIAVVPYAVSAKTGTLVMYLRGKRTAQHSAYQKTDTSVEIPAVTLEDIWKQFSLTHCDLLKLDIEGSEYDVLTATPPEILSRIDSITMEHHPFASYNLETLVRHLSASGFDVEVSKKSNHLSAYRRS